MTKYIMMKMSEAEVPTATPAPYMVRRGSLGNFASKARQQEKAVESVDLKVDALQKQITR